MALREREESVASERQALQSDLQMAMPSTGNASMGKMGKENRLDNTESELEKELRRTSPTYAEVRYPQRMNIGQVPIREGRVAGAAEDAGPGDVRLATYGYRSRYNANGIL